MRSIVLKKVCLTIFLLCSTATAWAGNREPIVLTDPVFDLRYDRRVVQFEPMPLSTLQRCGQISYLPNLTPVWFIYGRTVDEKGRTFYATGGYSIRGNPNPPLTHRYDVGGLGLIFFLDGDTCHEIGSIMETFTAGAYDDDTTEIVLSNLATDMATRYQKAFKGSAALKRAFRKHGVKRNKYAPELNKAFSAYYVR